MPERLHRATLVRVALLLFAVSTGPVFAQSLPPGPAAVETRTGCPARTDYQAGNYEIGNVTIVTPFDLLHLRSLSRLITNLKQEYLAALGVKTGEEFKYENIDAARLAIEGADLNTPPLGLPVSGSITLVYAENCRVENGRNKVDLEFWYMPARVPSFWSHSFESRQSEMSDPATPAGVSPRAFSLSPQAGYSATSHLFGGGRLNFTNPAAGLTNFSVGGLASPRMATVDASLSRGFQPAKAWMQRLDWALDYRFRDEPVGESQIRAGQLTTEWKAFTRPVSKLGWIFRYGGALEGGYRQSDVAPNAAEGVVSNTSYGGLKLFGGATVRTNHNSFAASYGILAAGRPGTADFRKQLVDVAHSWTWIHSHYPLDIDSRFNAGWIANLCSGARDCGVPVAERFFGGNVEHNFLTDNSWVIRSQPLLRSLPLNGLNQGSAGFGRGGNSFWTANFTVAFPAYRKPLIPDELLNNPGFMQRLDETPRTARQLLAGAYANQDKSFTQDPGLEKSREFVPPIQKEVEAIRFVWDSRESTIPDSGREKFSQCSDDFLDAVPLDVQDVLDRKDSVQLLSNRTSNLAKMVECLQTFSTGPADPLLQSAQRLDGLRQKIDAVVQSTGTFQRAVDKATEDLVLAERTIHTLFHEVNLISVGPVFVFDTGAIGPSAPGLSTLRYGIGGGARVTIASTVRFTLGYAVNANRGTNEGRGALFASLEVLDIFR